MTPLLELRKVSGRYGRAGHVIESIDLSVAEGGVTVLLGANGAGKTTTLRAICNLMVKTEGEVLLRGKSISGLSTEKIADLGIAHVPDGRGTFFEMSVEENLRLGGYTLSGKADLQANQERVCALFPRLRERWRQQAGTLSGGEQQMLAVGRALMSRPKLILLDEPSFGLAPLVVRDIFATLRTINKEEKVGVLLVEQNAHLALELADHVYLLDVGRIVRSGSPSDMAADKSIREAYLGS